MKLNDSKNSTTFHLAIDLGATSGRAILAEFDGERIYMEEIHRFKYPMVPIRGHLFWNLPLIYEEIIVAMKKCAKMVQENEWQLKSIGIDSWGCDVAYFFKNGTLAGLPYCYRDLHTLNEADKFCERFGKSRVYEKTGIQFMDFNTLFQLDVIHKQNPELIDSADKILFIPDALSYMLTNRAVMEYTVASTSQILNPNTKELDEELLDAIGIKREKFGELVMPGTVVGNLSDSIQKQTGLGRVPVIAVAGHDTASAVIGVPSPDKNYAYLSCGTWSLLGVEVPSPIISEESEEKNFTNEGGIDGTVRFLKNICGLWLLERCREEFKEASKDISELAALCLTSSCESLINPDDPRFANPESMIRAIESFCAETGQDIPLSPADFTRVIFRSLANRYADVLKWLQNMIPFNINRLHVIGGGSKTPYLMQFTADKIGIPVVAGPSESTALGNILVQLKANGEVKDLDEMRKVSIASTETKEYYPNNY